jgi:signal transduction histidine kinase
MDDFSFKKLIVWQKGMLFAERCLSITSSIKRHYRLIEQLEATRAELAAAERREGILEERQRLAREIHDTLAQGFTSIVMHLEAAEGALSGDPETLQNHIDRARSTARDSLDQARRVVQDLRPDLLEKGTLPDAIKRTASHWKEDTGIPVTATTTGNPVPLHPNIEVTLLRAAQEALNNIRKHAQATTVQLTLSYMGDLVILDVQDNGVGLDGAEQSHLSGGFGLQAMRERVEACDGTLTLESDPGEGTTVVITIPFSTEEL